MEAVFFRWNDDQSKLKDVDGYFIPGGFAYEDRGRSGMVAARDSLMDFIGAEADAGKVVIGICNGAQVLVESGLIPNGDGLQMSLARNAIRTENGMQGLPLLSEWIWITCSCANDRCATSGWDGVMQIPIAHGEGRFTTRDSDLLKELKKNDQIAFSYCDADGNISENPLITPNGSMLGIAGICNPKGNVIALMPHPERAQGNGDIYFSSMREWILRGQRIPKSPRSPILRPRSLRRRSGQAGQGTRSAFQKLPVRQTNGVEIFIETIITNNEERTVEQAARRVAPALRIKQWKYLRVSESEIRNVFSDLTVFNANKELAFIRRGPRSAQWNAQEKSEDALAQSFMQSRTVLIRRDIPDTGASALGVGSETGIAYGIAGISEQELCSNNVLLEVFCNPHASTLERMSW